MPAARQGTPSAVVQAAQGESLPTTGRRWSRCPWPGPFRQARLSGSREGTVFICLCTIEPACRSRLFVQVDLIVAAHGSGLLNKRSLRKNSPGLWPAETQTRSGPFPRFPRKHNPSRGSSAQQRNLTTATRPLSCPEAVGLPAISAATQRQPEQCGNVRGHAQPAKSPLRPGR